MAHVRNVILTAACAGLLLAACSSGSDSESGARGLADSGVPTKVVSLGDSYISGEAGRWFGNSNGFTNIGGDKEAAKRTDRGASTYFDAGRAESIAKCHRSDSAEVHVGEGWTSVNLACSGATTSTEERDADGNYKPGIDAQGQLGLLAEEAAKSERIGAVVLSIGGNDIGFGPLLTQCITGFITSTRLNKDLCSKNSEVTSRISAEALAQVQGNVAGAIDRIVTTMSDAGYANDEWALIVQNYPDPIAPSNAIRYGTFTRQASGGCPFWDEDVDWVHNTVLPKVNETVAAGIREGEALSGKKVVKLDVSTIFDGRRLCEEGTLLAEETSSDDELRAMGERVHQVVVSAKILQTPYDIQESLHPNYLGQLALRNCLRQALNDGQPRSGKCQAPSDWSQTSIGDEPQVRFS